MSSTHASKLGIDHRSPVPKAIAALYDPALTRRLFVQLGELLEQHFTKVEAGQGPVLNWAEPNVNIAEARACLQGPHLGPPVNAGDGESVQQLSTRFRELVGEVLAHGQNLHHPLYVGHQVPASLPLAGVWDALGAATNQVMAVYEMGPWATAIERALIAELGEAFGLVPGRFAGLVTNGGSLANLTALLTARNVVLGDAWESGLSGRTESKEHRRQPVLLVQGDAHYCIARSAGILGLGTKQVIRVPLDAERRMDVTALDLMLGQLQSEGRKAVAVVACAGATPTGAFDPLHQIADICEKHGVWMHVDAAHGGGTILSAQHKHLVAGIERADSFICDAHKMLFVPALCAFVFYKNAAHRFQAFCQEAPYLFDPTAPGLADYDCGLMTIECTKRGAALGLWGVWSMFGRGLFETLVDRTFQVTRILHEKLQAAPDFEPLHEPQGNIQVFRHRPQALRDADLATLGRFNQEIRRRVIQSGRGYLAQTQLNGAGALRCTVMNPLTTGAHLDELLKALREAGTAFFEEQARG